MCVLLRMDDQPATRSSYLTKLQAARHFFEDANTLLLHVLS